jgi:hypothetical protein
MFRLTQEPSSGSFQYLAKNYRFGSTVLVGMDVVIVMAASVHIAHKHTGSHAAITLTTSMPTSTVEPYL